MKSQPDAASRVAAEVVTQLPVPSRLGMLRFERLNEATWAMLYLDPACERQFGLQAMEGAGDLRPAVERRAGLIAVGVGLVGNVPIFIAVAEQNLVVIIQRLYNI